MSKDILKYNYLLNRRHYNKKHNKNTKNVKTRSSSHLQNMQKTTNTMPILTLY